MKLILGSGSPRRTEILTKMGYRFDKRTADLEESEDESLGLVGLSTFNATLKANAIFTLYGDSHTAVLGSDTVVWLNGKAYGKPRTKEDAHRMLSELSGNTHQVGTAVTIITSERSVNFCEIAEVTFKDLSKEEITAYIEDIQVMDKAGSYAIQDGGDRIITHYKGEYETIMGLPVLRLEEELSKLKVVKS